MQGQMINDNIGYFRNDQFIGDDFKGCRASNFRNRSFNIGPIFSDDRSLFQGQGFVPEPGSISSDIRDFP
ncbi:hypothetical protein LWC05_16690 [Acetobacter sicerae]|uniref:Uncharacterized protein n=1 Tax=Acetobacter sicerae TaxID=85325 RepID=A0ABS8VX12_9PROT|nr:hypothetical protein [Acetobacter sicerae]MCE0745510.1 hypothetical protein [Acetobacter sicerae]